jgi:hypothetical protein
MGYIIKFLFSLAPILAAASAGLSVFAQTGQEKVELNDNGAFFRGVPSVSVTEIAVNDPTLTHNPLEVSAAWKLKVKTESATILGYDVRLVIKLKDGRTFQEKKSVGATETQVRFAVSIPGATANQERALAPSTSSGAAASANRKQDQRPAGASAQRSGAGAVSSSARAGNDARRTAAGDSNDTRRAAAGEIGRIVPQIAIESVSVDVEANYDLKITFFTRASRQKSFKF